MIPFLRRELPSIGVLSLLWLVSAIAWSRVPDRLPVHFDLHGAVDRYGSRAEGVLLVPAIATGLWLLLLVVPRLDPNQNLRSFQGAWDRLRVGVLVFLAFVHTMLLALAMGVHVDVGRVLGLGMGLFYAFIGNLLGKLRPNGFAGFRTPWTLTSVRSWNSTHRLTGWMFVAVGLVGALTSILDPALGIVTLVGGILVTTVVGAAWSWRVWRDDPDKVPYGGVRPVD